MTSRETTESWESDSERNRAAGYYWVRSSPDWRIAQWVPGRMDGIWHAGHWLQPGVDEWQKDKDLEIDEQQIIRAWAVDEIERLRSIILAADDSGVDSHVCIHIEAMRIRE